MTYTFKISRRLARIRRLALLALPLSAIASCAPGEAIDEGFAPPPVEDVTELRLNPDSTTLSPAATATFVAVGRIADGTVVPVIDVNWSATGGSVNAAGVYTAGANAGTFHVIARLSTGLADTAVVVVVPPTVPTVTSVSITPASVTLTAGQTQTFTASVGMSDGSTQSNPAVSWFASGGTISSSGAFTAGTTAGSFRVFAEVNGQADTSSVTVTVPVATIASIVLTPASVSLLSGQTQQFAVSAAMSDGSTQANPGVTWVATGGTITAGLYTAGGTAGTFRVIATSTNGKADSSTVTVSVPAATIASITLTPATVSLQSSQTQQFAVSASMSDGSTQANPGVTWVATGGTITAGLYTAGGAAGTFRVIATSPNGKADSSTVTVTVPVATIASITLSPATVSLPSGQTQQFVVSAAMSDGSTQPNPGVTWVATGGTITAGLYTAGGTAGTFRVIATSTNGKADSSTVTVSVPAATIASITLSPATVSLQSSQTQQFAVSASMSDGSTQANPGVTWVATGGTITAGLYTAGGTAGTFRVIATSANGKADSSTVTVTVPVATIASITLSPATVSLQSSQTQQFAVSATMSDGATQANPSVTWSATGGTVNAGLYTAGSSAGTFRVIATSTNGKADSSTVTVSVPAATISSVAILPGSVSLQGGQTQQFTASATMSDGSTQASPVVTWSATGGTVSGSGLYTAGSTAGTFRVIVASSNGHTDTSTVTLAVPVATIAALVLTPTTLSLQTGATQQYAVNATMSDGSTQSNPTVTWTATGGTLSGSALYTAGGTAGSYRVIVAASGKADTSNVTVTSGQAGPGTRAHEPAGYTTIADQGFASLNSAGWGVESGSPTVVADATGPASPGSVVRANYGAGYRAGGAPWSLERSLPGTTKLYLSLSYRLSSNFQGEDSGTNKMGFVWIHNNPAIFFSNEGSGSGNLLATMRLQNTSDSREYLAPNMGNGVVSRGAWHTWEVELVSNSNGAANGIVRWWLDGVLIGQYTDVKMSSASQARNFEISSIYPIWGGVSGTVSSAMSIDFDNIYLSGSN